MTGKNLVNVLLADDDKDDCLLFREALNEIDTPTNLINVNDGEQLLHLLSNNPIPLPAVLFLDLNMPRKNGIECLTEIRNDRRFKNLPVVIYSTSFEPHVVSMLFDEGAQYYIRKPSDFGSIKAAIQKAINLVIDSLAPTKENFVILP